MEVQKEAFGGLIEYYKLLPIENKRSEIINEMEELIANYSKLCSRFGEMPDMVLNKEMLNINRSNITEEEFLHALFAYINTLQDISAQFINKMCDTLENRDNQKRIFMTQEQMERLAKYATDKYFDCKSPETKEFMTADANAFMADYIRTFELALGKFKRAKTINLKNLGQMII